MEQLKAWMKDVNEDRMTIYLGNMFVDYWNGGKPAPAAASSSLSVQANQNALPAEEDRVLTPASTQIIETESYPVSLLSPLYPLSPLTHVVVQS